MNLSRTPKILLGAATALVAVFPFIFIALSFIPLLFLSASKLDYPEPIFISMFFIIFPISMLLVFLQLALMVFYISQIVLNKNGNNMLLIFIAVGLYFLPYFAMPAYYLIYILPNEPASWAMNTTTEK